MANAGAGDYLAGAGELFNFATAIETADRQAAAIRKQGEWERGQYLFNAQTADQQALDAFALGEESRTRFLKSASQFRGKQRVALGGQGIALNTGSARRIQEDTADAVAADAATIKTNAWRQAWGFKTQAFDLRQRAEMAYNKSKAESRNVEVAGQYEAVQSAFKLAAMAAA